jgi:pimeloyl-ACP methyl ester carboxylesterase
MDLGSYPRSPVILYGHSMGGSIAVKLLAALPTPAPEPQVQGLVLENAFTSIPDMVRTVYPSRWLPYYYLGPFVFDKWDALDTLRQCAHSEGSQASVLRKVVLGPASMLILNSANDELVPPQMGQDMLEAASRVGSDNERPGTGPRRIVIPLALHDDAFTRRQWKDAMRGYISKVAQSHK